ncbi:MAG: N-acetyltransferase, partial [Firmicutes bacterium]|nr:N-acetyltransferase [Bacillota bacterium]
MIIPEKKQRTLETNGGPVLIEGPVPGEELAALTLHEGLRAFRPPEKQKQALIEISRMDHGRVTVAHTGEVVVGYVAFHPPD